MPQETYVASLQSAIDPTVHLPADQSQTMYDHRPLWVRYDLDAVRSEITRDVWEQRPADIWRFRELLPVGNHIRPVSFNEHFSPLVDCPAYAKEYGVKSVVIKDESRLATGSFKSRGLTMAVTMAHHFGHRRIAISSNGNAGGAMTMYASRAGMESVVFVPEDTPRANILECILGGARVFTTNGLIHHNGRLIRRGHDEGLWFDVSTMKEPYRVEGKKTIGLELANQFKWQLPDVILFPTGGGTALIGMWKAFQELRTLGFLDSETMPRMICCQSSGCCPLKDAFDAGERFAKEFQNPVTSASGIRVPSAIGDFMVLDAVRESQGRVCATDESRLKSLQLEFALSEGFLVCPETATCLGAMDELKERGEIQASDRVVIFNTAVAQKYFDDLEINIPQLDIHQPIDLRKLVEQPRRIQV